MAIRRTKEQKITAQQKRSKYQWKNNSAASQTPVKKKSQKLLQPAVSNTIGSKTELKTSHQASRKISGSNSFLWVDLRRTLLSTLLILIILIVAWYFLK